MRKYCIIIAFVVLSTNAWSQALPVQITVDSLAKHLFYLAGPETQGRGTGTEGQMKAANYITERLKNAGLQPLPIPGQAANVPPFLQKVPLDEVTLSASTLNIGNWQATWLKDYYTTTNFKEQKVSAESITFIGYGIQEQKWDELTKAKITDKIVLVMDGEPKGADGKYLLTKSEVGKNIFLQDKLTKIAKWNPRAIIVLSNNFEQGLKRAQRAAQNPRLVINMPQTGLEIVQNQPIPTCYLPYSSLNQYLPELAQKVEQAKAAISKKKKPFRFELKLPIALTLDKKYSPITTYNIAGYLPGKRFKDQYVILSAHYDHLGLHDGEVYPGADDNGTGSTALLTLAQKLGEAYKQGVQPERNILFLWVTGEEKGLLGSDYFTQKPPIPLSEIVTDLNVDMIGRVDKAHENDSNYIYIIGSDKLSTALHQINEEANKASVNLKLDYTYNNESDPNRYYYRSDHYNFAKNGIPVIFYFSGVHADYHQPTDTPDKIMLGRMKTVANLILATCWKIANMPERIVVDKKERN